MLNVFTAPALSAIGSMSAFALICVVGWRRCFGSSFFASAASLWFALQLVFVFGVLVALDYESGFDLMMAVAMLCGLVTFLIGVHLASRSAHFNPRLEVRLFRDSPVRDDLASSARSVAVATIVIVCLGIGFLFTRQVGEHVFGAAFRQLTHFGDVDRLYLSELRRAATRESYVAAGYSLQFVGAIFPALIAAVLLRARLNQRIGLGIIGGALFAVNLLILSVAGGRQSLIFAMSDLALLFLAATSPLPSRARVRRGSALLAITCLLAAFALSTVLQGRLSANRGVVGLTTGTLSNLYDRVSGAYAADQLRALRLLGPETPAWGAQWLSGLSTALPGPNTTEDFDSRLHGLLYSGNTGGNVPLSALPSAYFNWGVIGILAVPCIAGAALQRFTITWVRTRRRDLSHTVILAFASYRLALWRDPYSLLLEGGVTLLVLGTLLRRVGRKDATAEAECRLIPPTFQKARGS